MIHPEKLLSFPLRRDGAPCTELWEELERERMRQRESEREKKREGEREREGEKGNIHKDRWCGRDRDKREVERQTDI